MYASFFGLQQQPFSIAPDPRYLFMSERHREALAHLLYGLDAGGGFVLLTGEIGTGKTTVCRCFLEQIPAHCNVAYIFNPKLTVQELLRSICDEFGVAHTPAVPGSETVKDCIDPLNAFLLESYANFRHNVLVIDEAQNLERDVLEQLRLLTNLETSERKLLQIILIGQPELRTMVATPSMEQLAQRVIARYHLDALTPEETRQYVAHRLSVAGLQGASPFGDKALERVHALTGGVPRRINLLCDRAMLGAYAAGSPQVTEAIVRQAGREVFYAPGASDPSAQTTSAARRWAWPVGALALAVLAGGAGWALRGAAPNEEHSKAIRPAVAPAAAVPAAAVPAASAPQRAEPASVVSAASAKADTAASTPMTMAAFLDAQPTDDALAAWKVLAAGWNVQLTGASADPCPALAREGLHCYRSRKAGLALLRSLDRPVMLSLVPSAAGEGQRKVTAVLRQLTDDKAVLKGVNGTRLEIPVAALATLWHGEITTLWRAPKTVVSTNGELMSGAAAQTWLDEQLTKALPTATDAKQGTRRARIRQFQISQGLTPDGQAGPLTLMLLNRAAGVNEPSLSAGG